MQSHSYLQNRFAGKGSLFLIPLVVFLMCACGKSNLDKVTVHQVSVLDRFGNRFFDSALDSFKLSETERLDVDGQIYVTPYHEQLVLKGKLKSQTDEKGEITVKSGKGQAKLSRWSSIELVSGKILICGGSISSGPGSHDATKRSWLYDPQSHVLVPGPDMVHLHVQPTVIKLRDGRIMLSGGYVLPSLKATAFTEIFDPKLEKFFDCGDMCIPRQDHASLQINDYQVIFAGGQTNSADRMDPYTASVELFDIKTRRHITVASLGVARSSPILILTADGVIAYGGWFMNSGDYSWFRGWTLLKV